MVCPRPPSASSSGMDALRCRSSTVTRPPVRAASSSGIVSWKRLQLMRGL